MRVILQCLSIRKCGKCAGICIYKGCMYVWLSFIQKTIDPSPKYRNVSDNNLAMQHFVTQMCTHVHISVTTWCTFGYAIGVLWDMGLDHCGIGNLVNCFGFIWGCNFHCFKHSILKKRVFHARYEMPRATIWSMIYHRSEDIVTKPRAEFLLNLNCDVKL